MSVADAMRVAAIDWIGTLDVQQRAVARAPFDVPGHRSWTYLPGDRPGLRLADMTAEQRRLAMALLDTGFSDRGRADLRNVLWTEAIRRALPQTEPGSAADPVAGQDYWVRVLGDPDGSSPWGWRVNGHHLALHATVVGGAVTTTPQFFGAEPATVLAGPHVGRRTLAVEQDLPRELLRNLDPGQRDIAVTAPMAPRDIRTRHDPVADPRVVPRGLEYGDMTPPQQELLSTLVHHYLGRVAEPSASRAWPDIVDAGVQRIAFTWAGGDQPGQGHYYAVTGSTFLIEYDNVQDDANHIHSVWRDLRHDWGEDVLAAHYAAQAHARG